jgi:hypothetical protein
VTVTMVRFLRTENESNKAVNYLLTFVETFNKEYLLKQYLQTDKTEPIYRKMYDQTVDAMKKYLVRHSQPSNYLFLGELPQGRNNPSNVSPKMDHLVCFMGGSFALGATEGPSLKQAAQGLSDRDLEDIRLGKELTRTCYENMQSSNVQDANQDSREQDIIIQPRDTHCLLRPETVESLFVLWRITGDDVYR